jgi:hypothetical protein
MKKLPFLPLFMFLLLIGCSPEDEPTPTPEDNEIPFVEGSKIIFTPLNEGRELLGTSDSYTQSLSKFDLASRTGDASSDQEQDYLDFASEQAQEWTESEILSLKSTITFVKTKMEEAGLNVDLPNEIRLVKSTMLEEGNSTSYTRNGYIVVRSNITEGSILHELFHLFSRINTAKRDELYATINFHKSNQISFPASLQDKVITNPDAPLLEHTINVTIDGKEEEAVFVILAKEDWSGGGFFGYIDQKLMLLEGDQNNKTAKMVNGEPVLKDFGDAPDLEAKIGTNTDYTLHPEEILADHFSLLVRQQSVPDPEFLEAMEAVLKE